MQTYERDLIHQSELYPWMENIIIYLVQLKETRRKQKPKQNRKQP